MSSIEATTAQPRASFHRRYQGRFNEYEPVGRSYYAVCRDDRDGVIVARACDEKDAAELAGQINACRSQEEAAEVTCRWHTLGRGAR